MLRTIVDTPSQKTWGAVFMKAFRVDYWIYFFLTWTEVLVPLLTEIWLVSVLRSYHTLTQSIGFAVTKKSIQDLEFTYWRSNKILWLQYFTLQCFSNRTKLGFTFHSDLMLTFYTESHYARRHQNRLQWNILVIPPFSNIQGISTLLPVWYNTSYSL